MALSSSASGVSSRRPLPRHDLRARYWASRRSATKASSSRSKPSGWLAGEVGDAAVRAGGPAGVRVRAIDGVEASVVEAGPRAAFVPGHVAAGEPDDDRLVAVDHSRARPELGRGAGEALPPPPAVRRGGEG